MMYKVTTDRKQDGSPILHINENKEVSLAPGRKYKFKQDKTEYDKYPIAISKIEDGIHTDSAEEDIAVTITEEGEHIIIELTITFDMPNLHYYSPKNPKVGGKININDHGKGFKQRNRGGTMMVTGGCSSCGGT